MKHSNLQPSGGISVEYLDTGKIGARSVAAEPIMLSRSGPELDYWEGEDEPGAGTSAPGTPQK